MITAKTIKNSILMVIIQIDDEDCKKNGILIRKDITLWDKATYYFSATMFFNLLSALRK